LQRHSMERRKVERHDVWAARTAKTLEKCGGAGRHPVKHPSKKTRRKLVELNRLLDDAICIVKKKRAADGTTVYDVVQMTDHPVAVSITEMESSTDADLRKIVSDIESRLLGEVARYRELWKHASKRVQMLEAKARCAELSSVLKERKP
jgi:hypothetical protein